MAAGKDLDDRVVVSREIDDVIRFGVIRQLFGIPANDPSENDIICRDIMKRVSLYGERGLIGNPIDDIKIAKPIEGEAEWVTQP